MACVRKRRGKYVVDWRDRTGVRHWKTFDRKTDADAFRDKVGPEARQRLIPTLPASVTIKEYADHWTNLIAQSVKTRTLHRYNEILSLHLLPQFGKIRVQDLDRSRIRLFLTSKLQRGLERRTVRNIHAVLRAMLNAAIEDGLIASNPASQMGRALKLTISKAAVQEQIKAMSLEQLRTFLTTTSRVASRVYCLFRLLSATGMRLGEALALQYEDLDFSAQVIRISRAFSEDGTLETPKSGHGRSVQISESLAKMLVMHEMMRREEKDRFCWPEMPTWLFVTRAGTAVDPANVRRSMQRILKEAQLPLHFTPHCLRHTYASILLAEGTPAPFVQEQLGHASIELTVSTYGRWLKKKAPGALDRLDVVPGEELSTRSGSKVVAAASYEPHPLPATNVQVHEIPLKVMEPATWIEQATCGLRNRCSTN